MVLDDDEVIQILKLLDESNFDELQLEMEGMKLMLRKGGKGAPVEEPQLAATATKPLPTAQPAVVEKPRQESPAVPSSTSTATVQPEIAPTREEGVIGIMASSVGTFYRSPKPGAPPFVEVGSLVAEDDTVCILEVMKCFISVKAKVKGTIVKICAQNEQMVEFGQELFLVKLANKAEPVTHE